MATEPSKDIEVAIPGTYTVVVPQEVGFWMREKDWMRIRRNVASMKEHERQFYAAGWAFVGLGVGAAFAALGWVAPYLAFKPDDRAAFAWIWVAIVALAVIGAIGAVVCFVAARVTEGQANVTANAIVADMDNVHPTITTV